MGNWHKDRNLLKGDYTDTFPLWIHPWVSGIYALEINERVARPGDKVPAVLTAYRDEFGEATCRFRSTAAWRKSLGVSQEYWICR